MSLLVPQNTEFTVINMKIQPTCKIRIKEVQQHSDFVILKSITFFAENYSGASMACLWWGRRPGAQPLDLPLGFRTKVQRRFVLWKPRIAVVSVRDVRSVGKLWAPEGTFVLPCTGPFPFSNFNAKRGGERCPARDLRFEGNNSSPSEYLLKQTFS